MSFLSAHLLVSLFLNTLRLSIVTKMTTKLDNKTNNMELGFWTFTAVLQICYLWQKV